MSKIIKSVATVFILLCAAMMVSAGVVDVEFSETENPNTEMQSPNEQSLTDEGDEQTQEILDHADLEDLSSNKPEINSADPNSQSIVYGSAPLAPNEAPSANAGADRTIDRNEIMQFDGSGSTDPDGWIAKYTWYFQDDSVGSGVNPTHSFDTEGFYNVILVVEDNQGATDQDTVCITVHNIYPDAQAELEMYVCEDSPVSFDAAGSIDTTWDYPVLTYFWEFGDGSFGMGMSPTHTYTESGLYIAILIVTDNDMVMDRDFIAVNVENLPPVADAGLDQIANEDSVVTFDGSGSTDTPSDLPTLSYSWDFGDGSLGNGISPTHVYLQTGTYTVYLTVTDNDCAQDINSMTVTVNNVLPTADAGADQTVNEDQLVFFSGTGMDTPSDQPLLSYAWDFGDGSVGNVKNPIHAYQDEGIYTVTLTVTDDDGGLGQDTMQVTVANIGPVVDCGPDVEVNEDVLVQFMGYAYDTPSDEQSLSYSWDFGDGNSGSGKNPTHSYSSEGTYTVTLTVTDDDSIIGTDAMTITVKNIPPTAVATCTAPCSIIIAGDVLTFDCVVYDSLSDLSTITYHWDFGDGTSATGASVTHAYAVEGIYQVTLTITDDDGATGQDILVVIVERHTMEMEITSLVDEVMPGETAEYVITLRNTGTIDDAYDLAITTSIDPIWIDFDRLHVLVEAKSEMQIPLIISPPETLPLDSGIILDIEVAATCTHEVSEVSNAPLFDTASDDLTILATYESRLRWAQVEIEDLITDFAGGNPTDATLLKALEEVSEALFFSCTVESPEFDYVKSIEHVKDGIHNLEVVGGSVAADYIISLLLTAVDSEVEETIITAEIQAGVDNIHVVDAWDLYATAQDRILVGDYPNGLEQYKNAYMEAERSEGEWVPEEYTSALLQAVNDIDILLSGPYSPAALNKLQQAKDELIAALDNCEHGLIKDSFVNVKSAVMHLQNAEVHGAPTSSIVIDLTEAIENTVEMLISETATHVGMEVNDIKQAWSKFYQGKSFAVAGQYVQAIDKYDGAYKHALLAEDWIPIADAGADQYAYEDEVVFLDAANSRDRDGIVLFYEWDFGDGYVDYGVFTSHAYKDAGIYIITLLVTDNEGLMDTDTMVVTVNNEVPSASMVFDYILADPMQPNSVFMDDIILFDAIYTDTFSDVPDLVMSWDFGDGTTEFGAHVEHAYTAPGIYTVTLTNTDEDGDSDTSTATITVLNVVPEASVTYSQIAFEDEVVYLSGNGLDSSSDMDTLTYSWDFGDGTTGLGKDVTHIYADEGTYTVTLQVEDVHGGLGTSTATVSVINPPPTADAGWVQFGDEDSAVNFIGTGLDTPSDQSTLTYYWDFGDGSGASGAVQSHTYSISGTYMATLTVTDDNGDIGVDRIPVFVENVRPTADAGADQMVNEDDIVFFSGSGSDTISDIPTLTYSWDFGDGSTGSGMAPTHVYNHAGLYTVTLTVTDDDGAEACDEMTVMVQNIAPAADAGSDVTTNEDELVFLSGTGTDTPSDQPLLSYEWDFGDGSSPDFGTDPIHSYELSGTYIATLTVTDDDGTIGTDTLTITVNNVAPTAFAGPDLFVSGRLRYLDFHGLGYDTPSDQSSLTYHWNFGDGGSASGIFAQHIYWTSGTYTVTLTVTDDDGAQATDSLVIVFFLDSDEDGLPDHWEILYGLDPYDPEGDNGGQGDPDNDGLTNREEYGYGTHPKNRDTDGDSFNSNFWDKAEIAYWLSKGKTNEEAGVNANTWDVDGDTMPDGWEVWYSQNPAPGTAYNLHDPDDYSDKNGDPDDDGLGNFVEYKLRDKGAHPHCQDMFVEVDWMPGHYPDTTIFDYIEDYYGDRGIHLVFELSDEIQPYDPIMDRMDWNNLHRNKPSGGYFDNDGTHKHMIYGAQYAKVMGAHPFGVNKKGCDDQVFIGHQTIAEMTVLFNLAVIGIATAAAIAAGTAAGIAAALIAAPLGPIAAAVAYAAAYAVAYAATFTAILLAMSITEWQAATATVMHELGHSINIIDKDAAGKEVYCNVSWCVMAGPTVFMDALNDNPSYCEHHWSQRRLSPVRS